MLEKLTAGQFQEIIGSDVEVTVMTGPNVTLKLDGVRVSDPKCDNLPDSCRKEPFTISLSGDESHQAPDGVYDLMFDRVGLVTGVYIDNKADMARSPDAPKPDGAGRVLYEVVFS